MFVYRNTFARHLCICLVHGYLDRKTYAKPGKGGWGCTIFYGLSTIMAERFAALCATSHLKTSDQLRFVGWLAKI